MNIPNLFCECILICVLFKLFLSDTVNFYITSKFSTHQKSYFANIIWFPFVVTQVTVVLNLLYTLSLLSSSSAFKLHIPLKLIATGFIPNLSTSFHINILHANVWWHYYGSLQCLFFNISSLFFLSPFALQVLPLSFFVKLSLRYISPFFHACTSNQEIKTCPTLPSFVH